MKTLYWIDDSHDKGKPPNAAAQKRLEKGLNVQLRVEAINEREQFGKLLSTLDGTKTCGVIMDYQLTKVGENGQMAFGTTWAAEIRAAHPTVPVIGISHERENDIPKLRLESFLAFFPREQLMGPTPPIQDILALLSGYSIVCKILKKQDGKPSVDLMVDLAMPPKHIADLFRAAIPSVLREKWDAETPHVVGRWLWHELQGLPGFLFDELGLATYLGLNGNGLKRVCSRFDGARYCGAFASNQRPRWWVGSIRGIFENIIGQQIAGPISHARLELLKALNVKNGEYQALLSRPHGRKNSEVIPDCVAYGEDEREEDYRVQALFEDTVVDDRDANAAFGFESRRIIATKKVK
jgi:hypothetical protein